MYLCLFAFVFFSLLVKMYINVCGCLYVFTCVCERARVCVIFVCVNVFACLHVSLYLCLCVTVCMCFVCVLYIHALVFVGVYVFAYVIQCIVIISLVPYHSSALTVNCDTDPINHSCGKQPMH